jgi:hypothetical protein
MPLQCATVSLGCSAVGDTGHKTPSPKLTLPATTSATVREILRLAPSKYKCTILERGVRPLQRLKWKRGGSFRFCIICGEATPPSGFGTCSWLWNFCRWSWSWRWGSGRSLSSPYLSRSQCPLSTRYGTCTFVCPSRSGIIGNTCCRNRKYYAIFNWFGVPWLISNFANIVLHEVVLAALLNSIYRFKCNPIL